MSDFNLGTVTAYGYAKDKGYTGTEDEYAELMASYADVAEQAAESAEQAAASATTATAKASDAAASATAAASSKTAAETAQGGAETAAQTATTKAGEATTAATTATNKATEATTAATTATGKATEAAGSATTATTKAGEASTSATNAAASATRAQEILDSIPEDYSQLSDDVSDLKDGLQAVQTEVAATLITDTASGSIASFPDGADGVPVKSLTVNVEPVQSGSGDPSPTNIRPISGHTSAVVTVSPTTDAQDGTSYTIDLDGTRYGGTLDVGTGVLTVDMALKVFDGSENWTKSSSASNGYYLYVNNPSKKNGCVLVSDKFKYTNDFNTYKTQYGYCYSDGAINLSVDPVIAGNTVTSFKEWLANNHTQIVYEMAEPITVQLTAEEVTTLKGQNNIWSDAGDVEVEYRADTKLYIQKVLNA